MIQHLSSVLLLASVGLAQTGLPQQGVLLGGTVASPILINNSSHRILAYGLIFDLGNGASHPVLHIMIGQLRNKPMSAVGIAPGSSISVDANGQAYDASGKSRTAGSVAVTLDSVLFEDGTLVGPDKARSIDGLMARVDAEKDVHAILASENGAASAWTTLEGFASGQNIPATPPGHTQAYQNRYQLLFKEFAAELVRVRAKGGDAMALRLAHASDYYPVIRKGE